MLRNCEGQAAVKIT